MVRLVQFNLPLTLQQGGSLYKGGIIMENFEQNCEDLKYLASEIRAVLDRFRSDIPEDFHKVLLDLAYYIKTIAKEMENEYERFNEARDSSSSELC